MRSWKNFFRNFFVLISVTSFLMILGLFISSFFYHKVQFFYWQDWLILVLITGIINIIFWKQSPLKDQVVNKGFDRSQDAFQKEIKRVLKGYLKMSFVFWLHTLKREKAISQDVAIDKIIKNLHREFRSVDWMKDLLDNIEKESRKRNKQ